VNPGVEGEANPEPGKARIIDLADPGCGDDANEVQGHNHNATVSIIVTNGPPGLGNLAGHLLQRNLRSDSSIS
jgi:hypothetical protein